MTMILKWVEHNRYLVAGPILGLIIWAYAVSCTPLTPSPLEPGRLVNTIELDLDFKTWQAQQQLMAAKFEAAGQDLTEQKARADKLQEDIISLAAGGIPDVPGLVKLVLGGGGLGAIIDNIRKGGVIGGLKINRKEA